MMEIVLIPLFLFPDGTRISGENIDGWHGRVQASEKACLERRAIAQQMPLPTGVKAIMWFCVKRRATGVSI